MGQHVDMLDIPGQWLNFKSLKQTVNEWFDNDHAFWIVFRTFNHASLFRYYIAACLWATPWTNTLANSAELILSFKNINLTEEFPSLYMVYFWLVCRVFKKASPFFC